MTEFKDIQNEIETKGRRLIRRVRTPGGMRHFGQSIGSIIVADGISGLELGFGEGGGGGHIVTRAPNKPFESTFAAVAVPSDSPETEARADNNYSEVPTDYEGTRKWKVPGRRGRLYTWQDEEDGKWVMSDHVDNVLAEGDTEQSVIDALRLLIKPAKKKTSTGKTKKTRATGKHIQPFRKATEEDLQKLIEVHGSYMKTPPRWHDSAMVADKEEFWNFDPPLKWVGNKGKVQARYSQAYRDRADAGKFDRVRQLVTSGDIDKLDAWLEANWRTDDTAAALFLMRKTGMRPSSEDNEVSDGPTYGATTLQARHVTVNKESVRVLFEGKGYWAKGKPKEKRKKQDHTYRDAELMELFTTWSEGKTGRQEIFPGASDVSFRNAMKEHAGGDYKVYDLRTLVGTEQGLRAVQSLPTPKNATEFKKLRNEVGDIVSEILGNTRTVALKSYIDPAVFDDWKEAIGDV